MHSVFKKLNFKDQQSVYVLKAPDSFESVLSEMELFTTIQRILVQKQSIGFVIVFCTLQKEVDEFGVKLASLLSPDAVFWIAYPKGSSKKFTCDFNRDTGWKKLGELGFEPVRQVAIDEDWSALRFRKVEYIKSMTRSFAITKEGKKRLSNSQRP